MKQFFGKVWKYGKAVVVPVGTIAVTLGAQGYFGPKGAAIAAGVGALYGLLLRRPQDTHPSETKVAKPDLTLEPGEDLQTKLQEIRRAVEAVRGVEVKK